MTNFSLMSFKKSCNFFTVIFLFAVLAVAAPSQAQVTVASSQTALALASKLVGTGVQISGATLTCPTLANGIFTVVTSNLGLDSGIVLTTGTANTVGTTYGVNGIPGNFASTGWNAPGDPDLNTIGNTTTHDACVLQFDFIPAGDTVKFGYVFGSDEYPTFNCSINDVFGFLISGPGITGTKNIALIPGTNFPVAISTINNGAGAAPGNPCYTNTGGNGPFTAYFVTNTGTSITYYGFTTVLQAIQEVQPCQTYHLKIAIADASDDIYDSGVFLKAGSLSSNAISITPQGGGGLNLPTPYCVRNCLPGQFIFTRPVPKTTPLTIHYQIVQAPTTTYAVNGVDYNFIPDSVVIPANATSVVRQIFAVAPPTGTKIVKLRVLSPYSCGVNTPVIDSAQLTIYDNLQVNITTPDTAICLGQSVHILVSGPSSPTLSYSWSPATGLNNPNIQSPTATPLVSTTYTLSTNLPGSGCTPTIKQITISIKQPPTINMGPDRTTCIGTPFTFAGTINPPVTVQTYTYNWAPGTDLSGTTVLNPTFTPTTVGTVQYIITADPGAAGCTGHDTINVTTLPGDIQFPNHDTAVCEGITVQMNSSGDPAFTYTWTPPTNVSNPTIVNPAITLPNMGSYTYTLTASYPTCPNIVKSIKFDVQPNPIVYAGADRAKCQWDTIHLNGIVTPGTYTQYAYSWSANGGIDDPTKADITFSGMVDTTLTLTVTTPAGCSGSDDVKITVHPGNFASLTPADTAICPRDSVVLRGAGGVSYTWTPALYLNATTGATVVSHPLSNISYTGYVIDQFGCKDTLSLDIVVHPEAVLSLGDSVTLYPGESFQMNPQGNCLYYSWFPPVGLSSPNIANPIAMPTVNTQYIVHGSTESGCTAIDTIVVMIAETALAMPNAFSPGSAPNDIFKIDKRGIASLKYFRIFNRWGVKVFETTDIETGWNGRFNDVPQPMGVYVYVVEAETNTGRVFTKQGNVTLIR